MEDEELDNFDAEERVHEEEYDRLSQKVTDYIKDGIHRSWGYRRLKKVYHEIPRRELIGYWIQYSESVCGQWIGVPRSVQAIVNIMDPMLLSGECYSIRSYKW